MVIPTIHNETPCVCWIFKQANGDRRWAKRGVEINYLTAEGFGAQAGGASASDVEQAALRAWLTGADAQGTVYKYTTLKL